MSPVRLTVAARMHPADLEELADLIAGKVARRLATRSIDPSLAAPDDDEAADYEQADRYGVGGTA